MARDNNTMKTEKAAFSKSVICTSILRNSTRQPMEEPGGGGLNRKVCQFVDWMFYLQDISTNHPPMKRDD